MNTVTSSSADTAAFESFYKDVRGRLLLQTWALTGDLPAAQKAVRDALVVAWHHWRKVSILDDPEAYVRPVAWSRALRRASARPFHRERGFDDSIRATLNALSSLPVSQRRIVLLAHLTTLPIDQIAQAVGMTQHRTERELQRATAAFSLARDVPATQILHLFEPMAAQLREVRWPRQALLTRAGSTRRRLHTAVGAGVAVAAFIGAGVIATDERGTNPALDNLALHTAAKPTPASAYPLRTANLLSDGIVTNELGGTWDIEMTSDNTSGDGLVLPCQTQRFADRSARATLMRTLTSGSKKSERMVGQAVEVSASAGQAQTAWRSAVNWYAGCNEDRVQLVSTRKVTGVGDEATAVVLRDWSDNGRIIVASVARTGVLTTAVVAAQPASAERAVARTTSLLSLAVTKLCALPEAGRCASDVANSPVSPLPLGSHPTMLGTLDLPPVRSVSDAWAATKPVAAKTNLAATVCDQSSFNGKGITKALTRSFVIPSATDLPAQFGLTETVGTWKTSKAAAAFIKQARGRVASCPERELGTTVESIETVTVKGRDVSVWRITAEISDSRAATFLMAVVRTRNKVAQVGFVPDGNRTISNRDFVALVNRANERLALKK